MIFESLKLAMSQDKNLNKFSILISKHVRYSPYFLKGNKLYLTQPTNKVLLSFK